MKKTVNISETRIDQMVQSIFSYERDWHMSTINCIILIFVE